MTTDVELILSQSNIPYICKITEKSLQCSQTKTRPSASENRCKLYLPERQLTKANQPSLNLEGAQGQI